MFIFTDPMAKLAAPIAAVVLMAFVLGASPRAVAQDQCGVKRDKVTGTLTEASWKKLNSIYEDVGEEKYDEAYADLLRMLNRSGRDKYLSAIVNQALAQVEWARGNYDSALTYFETAVELDALPDQSHFALMYQIAQLYFMKERYDEALERLELWFCEVDEEKITAHAWVLKATILVQKSDFANALTAIEQAIAMDDDPQEQWYQVKLVAHFELKQYSEAAKTLEVMITKWPEKRQYWLQLAQIYFTLENSERALAVMALAYRNGLLDQQGDFLFLSSLYSNDDVPYKAAEVLEAGIKGGVVEASKKNWNMVADAWYAAEELEKSLAAFEEAGRVADEGILDLRRGFILIDLERWPEALEALTRALDKGGLGDNRTGEAYLLRGMAQFNLGRFDSASSDWNRARQHDKTRDAAVQWMNHMREERRRKTS